MDRSIHIISAVSVPHYNIAKNISAKSKLLNSKKK